MISSNNNNGSCSSKHVADLAESAAAQRSAISTDVRDLITDFASSLYLPPPHSFSLTLSITISGLDFYFFSIEFGKYHIKILRECSTSLPH